MEKAIQEYRSHELEEMLLKRVAEFTDEQIVKELERREREYDSEDHSNAAWQS